MLHCTVGQKVWFARLVQMGSSKPFDPGCEVTVTSVGYKWIKLSNGRRVDNETGKADCGRFSPDAGIWISQEIYLRDVRAQAAWRTFCNDVGRFYTVPPGVTAHDIEVARATLRLPE